MHVSASAAHGSGVCKLTLRYKIGYGTKSARFNSGYVVTGKEHFNRSKGTAVDARVHGCEHR